MYFIGDGTEILAAEAYRENALEALKLAKENNPSFAESIGMYECDITERCVSGVLKNPAEWYYVYPAERDAAAGYDMPTLARVRTNSTLEIKI